MTADVELLTLPDWMDGYTIPSDDFEHDGDDRLSDRMKVYARANALHHTAAQAAEIEALKSKECESFQKYVDANEARIEAEARAERLAEALRIAEAALADIGDADREPGDDVAWCERRASEPLPMIRALLREQEGGK